MKKKQIKKFIISILLIIITLMLPMGTTSADYVEDLSELGDQIIEFLESTDENIIIVEGSFCSNLEYITLEYLKTKFDIIVGKPVLIDTDLLLNETINKTTLVFFSIVINISSNFLFTPTNNTKTIAIHMT